MIRFTAEHYQHAERLQDALIRNKIECFKNYNHIYILDVEHVKKAEMIYNQVNSSYDRILK